MGNVFLDTAEELAPYHLTVNEVRCHADGNSAVPCPDCGGQIRLLRETAEAFKVIREEHGAPLTVTSGNRCQKKQARLFAEAVAKYGDPAKAAKKVARPGGSPHEWACALDIKAPAGMTAIAFRRLIESVLGQECRLGTYATFVHIDCGFLLQPNPFPRQYVRGVRW